MFLHNMVIGIRTESELILCKPVYLEYKELQTKPGLGWNGGLSIRGNFTIIGTWFMVFNSAKTILPSLQRATFSK
jgi:hypothetical protein